MAADASCRGATVEKPKFGGRDLDHSKLSLSRTFRNGPTDAQFPAHIIGLSAEIRFADIASHLPQR